MKNKNIEIDDEFDLKLYFTDNWTLMYTLDEHDGFRKLQLRKVEGVFSEKIYRLFSDKEARVILPNKDTIQLLTAKEVIDKAIYFKRREVRKKNALSKQNSNDKKTSRRRSRRNRMF
ncbi:MAG: hypothetical protein N4A44_00800 [Alphaproteobacteria bacterium]|jgi:hypothetical protein|nr:hypothetical protein [Alphaproteobacteria bacterium]